MSALNTKSSALAEYIAKEASTIGQSNILLAALNENGELRHDLEWAIDRVLTILDDMVEQRARARFAKWVLQQKRSERG